MIHILGFSAAVLIVSSVTMRSIVWLRTLGLAGSMVFVTYGLVLPVWPLVATNAITMTVHAYQLNQIRVERSRLPV